MGFKTNQCFFIGHRSPLSVFSVFFSEMKKLKKGKKFPINPMEELFVLTHEVSNILNPKANFHGI